MPKDRKPPYFPFYVDDFSSDGKVEAMTTEEVGAYILLLCKAWREEPVGSIPNDDLILARWARLEADRWEACKPKVLASFRLGTDDRWHQRRMRREYEKLRASKKLREKAAKTAANKRWHGNDLHANGMRNASHSKDTPSGVSRDSPSKSDTPPTPSRGPAKRAPPAGGGVGVSKFSEQERAEYAESNCDREGVVLGWGWVRASADGLSDTGIESWRARGKPRDPRLASETPPTPGRAPSSPTRVTLDEAREIVNAMRELGREARAVIADMPLEERDRETLLAEFCPQRQPLAAGGG